MGRKVSRQEWVEIGHEYRQALVSQSARLIMLLQMTLGIARCASLDFCPNDKAILEAVQAVDAEETFALSQVPEYEQALIVAPLIKEISEVFCGEKIPGDVPTVSCKFTVHYSSHDSFQIARFTFTRRWEIEQSMEVARRR